MNQVIHTVKPLKEWTTSQLHAWAAWFHPLSILLPATPPIEHTERYVIQNSCFPPACYEPLLSSNVQGRTPVLFTPPPIPTGLWESSSPIGFLLDFNNFSKKGIVTYSALWTPNGLQLNLTKIPEVNAMLQILDSYWSIRQFTTTAKVRWSHGTKNKVMYLVFLII